MAAHSVSEQLPKSGWFNQWWLSLAYHHKWAESLLYMMFFSGILLWDRVGVMWQVERWLLLAHMLVGATLFSLIVGAFWGAHRRLIVKSNKPFLRQTGTLIEWLLIACSLSGFYLIFYGNTGNTLGVVMQNIHFYSSWLLAPLVFRHAMRWSVLNLSKFFK
ncbi:hypothetical protein [Photobacterium sanguinicancri]|uniref:hypothetical protein n=1 Tax=Photobacterium sanguinicancri TaxID=875932 RepID=UPI0007898C69|nr:hypothetical protein [Photobacterium sanguinicancri]KXI23073.1 hypothetical protein AS132_09285 [Photobacterium sanguinicancri]